MMFRLFGFAALVCAHALGAWAQSEEPAAATLFVGDTAPALEVSAWVKGAPLEKLDPEKTYVVGFWSSWSKPSKAVLPLFSELLAKHRANGIELLGIFVRENVEGQAQTFVTEMGDKLAFALAIDAPKKIPAGSMELPDGKPGQMAQSWLVAAGKDAVPTAFVVHKSKIAWIGPPMSVDATLAAITAGTFDLEAAAKADRAHAALMVQRRALSAKLRVLYQNREHDKFIAAIDEAVAATPALEVLLAADKFTVLLAKGDVAGASAYGAKAVDGCLRDDAQMLNQVAWTIVDPAGSLDRTKRDLALARKAAERAIVLTKEEDWAILDTLALVCFDQLEAARAVELQEKAVKLADARGAGDDDPSMRTRLEQFRKAVAEKK